MTASAISIFPGAREGLHVPNLVDLLRLAGPQALASRWRCRGIEAFGSTADELHAADDERTPVDGIEFLRIAEGISQMIEGELSAMLGRDEAPWLRILVVDGCEVVVISTDDELLASMRAAYPHARDSPEDCA